MFYFAFVGALACLIKVHGKNKSFCTHFLLLVSKYPDYYISSVLVHGAGAGAG